MSLNSRTIPTKKIAARRFARDREGRPVLPRVVERRPRPGDIHPLDRKHLALFLRYQPTDYLYGLKQVELRPRLTEEIGRPFGYYSPSEKAIVLYSVPAQEWHFPAPGPRAVAQFVACGATVTEEEGGSVRVCWTDPIDAAYFLYREVLLHELGHHYDYQYRHKRKYPSGRIYEETSANRHAMRLGRRPVFALRHRLKADTN